MNEFTLEVTTPKGNKVTIDMLSKVFTVEGNESLTNISYFDTTTVSYERKPCYGFKFNLNDKVSCLVVDIKYFNDIVNMSKRVTDFHKESRFPGIVEYENTISEWSNYRHKVSDVIENEDYRPIKKPTSDIENLDERFPTVALYKKCLSYGSSNNVDKYSAGKKAAKMMWDNPHIDHDIINEILNNWLDVSKVD